MHLYTINIRRQNTSKEPSSLSIPFKLEMLFSAWARWAAGDWWRWLGMFQTSLFLFQRISGAAQRFNSVPLHDGFINEWWGARGFTSKNFLHLFVNLEPKESPWLKIIIVYCTSLKNTKLKINNDNLHGWHTVLRSYSLSCCKYCCITYLSYILFLTKGLLTRQWLFTTLHKTISKLYSSFI